MQTRNCGSRMSSLFDPISRTDLLAMKYNESQFQYHNSSARPTIIAVRSLLENWFEHFPSEAKPDLRQRFRAKINSIHRSAFFELYVHELLRSMGYQMVAHPSLEGVGTHPDFLALRDSPLKCFVEATALFA